MKSSFRLNERVATRPAAETRPAPTKKPIDLVLIASSTGGPAALREVLSRLPQSFPYPVIVAQHMPPSFTTSLAQSLDRDCPLKVVEAAAGSVVAPGHVYLLPGGIQTRLTGRPSRMAFETVTGAADGGPRPSANLLFESASKCTDGRVLAVVLTGMGEDGKEGCQQLRQLGATILTQDEASCVVYGMPRAIADAGLADDVAPLNQIAARIQHFTGLGNSRLRASLPAADSGKLPFDQGVLR